MKYLTTCPCCGQPYETDKPAIVSMDSNILIYAGKKVSLTKRETEMAFILATAMPAVVTRKTIIRGIWAADPPMYADNMITMLAMKLRMAIKPLGLSIQPIRSCGYRLIENVTSTRNRLAIYKDSSDITRNRLAIYKDSSDITSSPKSVLRTRRAPDAKTSLSLHNGNKGHECKRPPP